MHKIKYQTRFLQLLIVVFATAYGLCAQGRGSRPTFQGNSITAPRPLSDIADVLQTRYGKPVTYEDPSWEWPGDSETLSGLTVVRSRTATLPPDLSPEQTAALDVGAVGRMLTEYEKSNDAPRFRVFESSYGLHIVPAIVRDASGQVVQAKNPLDAVVTIPSATRTASAHLEAICAAATQAVGREIRCSAVGLGEDWYERLFAAPGGTLEWGANGVKARDALIDLLSRAATTFTWHFNCGPGNVREADRFCVLNLRPILVSKNAGAPGATAQRLEFDRCPQCAVPRQNAPIR